MQNNNITLFFFIFKLTLKYMLGNNYVNKIYMLGNNYVNKTDARQC